MKVYPKNTGALCAKMDRGLSGQDGFNDMIPVIERTTNGMALCWEWAAAPDVNACGNEHAGLHARSANPYGGGTGLDDRKYILRRLTPLECARLQGFPDWWTDGVEGSDSNVYKMWGNGIALPCAADVIGRIAKEIEGGNNNEESV
jgi:site-specific DNA-cytosine methylase